MNLPFKINRWVFVVLHITFWLLLFSLPFLMRTYSENKAATNANHHPGFDFYILKCLFWTTFFYINAHFLLSRFVYKRKYGKYIFALFLLMAGGVVLELCYFLLTKSLSVFT